MPSEDTYHREHPEANQWMAPIPVHSGAASTLTVQEKRSETLPAGKRPATARIVMSGLVLRLALRLGVSPEELAKRIPEDTVRRTKFPVQEHLISDGSIEFEHPPGIIEGVRGTHSVRV